MAASTLHVLNPSNPNRFALHGLFLGGVVALVPLLSHLPFLVIASFFTAVGWRYANEFLRWRAPQRLLRIALAITAVVTVHRYYGTLLGRDPGVALLVALIGLKFLELRTLRDYLLIVFLFFIVLLASFLYSQSLMLGVYALFVVLIEIAVLVRINQPHGLTHLGALRLAAILLSQALPLMLVIYFLFPRIEGALWAMPSYASGGRSGMPDTLRPGSINELSLSSEVAFRATFMGPPPPPSTLYWRGRVLWDTDGKVWESGASLANSDNSKTLFPLGNPVRYQVTLEPSDQRWLYALDLPATVPGDAFRTDSYTLEHRRPIRERYTYQLFSYPQYRTGPLRADEYRRGLVLPPISRRVKILADQWRHNATDVSGIVNAALSYFRQENFYYTLTPPLLGNDPVDDFLFHTRRGFCEHYASAFATLMRAAGVPSRVVIGYQGGEYNPAGNYLIVRQADAHAWTEVWWPERGWVRVDPTSAVAPERIELGIDALRRLQAQGRTFGQLNSVDALRVIEFKWFERAWRDVRLNWDYLNLSWYRWVSDYSPSRQQRMLDRLGIADMAVVVMAVTVGILLLFYAVFTLRTRSSPDPVIAAYNLFCRKLAHAGLVRTPHEGAAMFASRAAQQWPELRSSIENITNRYIRLRYGVAPTAIKVELRALKRSVKRFTTPRCS